MNYSTMPVLRQDIQQLRGIAVLAVIVNHLDFAWVPGGYLGVDMFFVLSGFVITNSMLSGGAQVNSGLQFFAQFWIRRAFRLWPMLFVTVLATTLFLFFTGLETSGTLLTGLSALMALSNIRLLIGRLEYFSLDANSDWFMHTWSLAVEEQIYLLLSIVFIAGGVHRKESDSSAKVKRLLWGIGVLAIVSAVLALLPFTSEVIRFYSPHTRVYQAGVGAFLALFFSQRRLTAVSLAATTRTSIIALSGAGLLALFVLNPWSGRVVSFVATVLTVNLIAAASVRQQTTGYVRGRWLNEIGDRSYALYLVHWPVTLVWTTLTSNDAMRILGTTAFTFALASLGHQLVEAPLRHRWRTLSVRRAAGTAILSLTVVTITTWASYTLTLRSSDVSLQVPPKTVCSQADDAKVWLSGDSHLDTALLPVITETLNGDCYFWGGFDFLFSWEAANKDFAIQQPARVTLVSPDILIERLEESTAPPSALVLVHYLTALLSAPDTAPKSAQVFGSEWMSSDNTTVSREDFLALLAGNLEKLAMKLGEWGGTLVVTSPQPDFDWLRAPIDVSSCSTTWISSRECVIFQTPATITRRQHEARGADVWGLLDELADRIPNFVHLRLDSPFCGASSCSNYLGDEPQYRDDDHLNESGAEALRPLFRDLFRRVLRL